jgi:hypothetical protein
MGPVLRWKRFGLPFRWRFRMNLKRKPTQISLEVSRGLFGPDRAEITKRSNNVRPDVDDAIQNCDHRSTDYSVAIKIARTLIPYRRERGYSLRILIIWQAPDVGVASKYLRHNDVVSIAAKSVFRAVDLCCFTGSRFYRGAIWSHA